jgi:hypothetical protein
MSEPSPEFNLLDACVRTVLAPDQGDGFDVRRQIKDDIDWDGFCELAAYHRVYPLVNRALASSRAKKACPPDIVERFEDASRAFRYRNQFLLEELHRVLEGLRDHNIPALPLKGPTLAEDLYGSLCLRQSSDIDLLVPEDAAQSVEKCLSDFGYHVPRYPSASVRGALRNFIHGQFNLTRGRVFYLDVHLRMVPPLYAYNAEFQELHRRSTTTIVAERTFPRLAPPDRLLLLCHHGIKNQWKRYTFLCDIAGFIENEGHVDWQEVLSIAHTSHAKRALCLGVYLAHEVVGSALPPDIAREMETMENIRRIAHRLKIRLPETVEKDTMKMGERTYFHFVTQDSFRAKLQYVAAAALRRVLYWV